MYREEDHTGHENKEKASKRKKQLHMLLETFLNMA